MNIDTLKARIAREGYNVDPEAVAEAIISRVHPEDDEDAAEPRVTRADARTREARVVYPQRQT